MSSFKLIAVGDSPMTRIMDLLKENINQELSCSKHLACLRVR